MLVGKFQGERVIAYLHKMAGSVENFHSTDIYSIPLEGRTPARRDPEIHSVAASNHDKSRHPRHGNPFAKAGVPFAGPALFRQYYKSLPGGQQILGRC